MGRDDRSRHVAGFARELRWDEIPATVQEQVVRCVLDLCGAALAGSRTPVAQAVSSYASEAYGCGSCTVIGASSRSTPTGAALTNGFAASALDIDDGYRPVKGHPGAVVFPTVLAAAEETGASGPEFLTALVVAYEVSMRTARILHGLYDFYHGSGAWGPVGAAAGAARLFGCDVEEIRHALGIAEFHAPITPEMRSVDHPSMLKDGIGWGALSGLASAQLASHGFTGIPSLFDENDSGPALVESLGSEYLTLGLYFKLHACCRWAQPAVEGTLAAVSELNVEARDIARVRVHSFEAATHLTFTAPPHYGRGSVQSSLAGSLRPDRRRGRAGPGTRTRSRRSNPARPGRQGRVLPRPGTRKGLPGEGSGLGGGRGLKWSRRPLEGAGSPG